MAVCLRLEVVRPSGQTVGERGEENIRPFPRSGHRVVVDEGNLYVLGGYNPDVVDPDEEDEDELNKRIFVQLWKFNFFTHEWREIQMTGDGPIHLASHSATLTGTTMLTYGGSGIPFGERSSQNVHMCRLDSSSNTVTWRCLQCSGDAPEKKYGHCQLVEGPYLYIIGGTTGFIYNSDVHRLDLRTCHWECLFDSRSTEDRDQLGFPIGRYRHEMVLHKDRMYMFGGGRAFHAHSMETIPAFNLTTCEWEEMVTKPDPVANSRLQGVALGFPAARRCHSCVLYKDAVYLFGGRDNMNVFGDLWRFALDTLQWTHIPLQSSLKCFFHHAAVTTGGCMYVFGGVLQVEENERSNEIHRIWLNVPSLQEIAWIVISSHLSRQRSRTYHSDLLDLGVPRQFVQRLPS